MTPTLDIPRPKDKNRPLVVPAQVVTARRLEEGTGYMRVTMFPGVIGMDVARDMSRAVQELAADRLVVDLRGNTGGGIGCLRLMSLLCADRRGVGYSVGKATAKKGYRVALPVAEYYTWAGKRFEGTGVQPDREVPTVPSLLSEGTDRALNESMRWLAGRS